MKYILILSQDIKNKSVEMLAQALRAKKQEDQTVLVWDVSKARIQGTQIFSDDSNSFNAAAIDIKDIELVIKRTWGPIRARALSLCQQLESAGVSVLNGSEFIDWSHSKIKQYHSLNNLFPKTVCFDSKNDSVNKLIDGDHELPFPLVLKTDEGCRGDGIYLIESQPALAEVLQQLQLDLANNKALEFKNGFLLQELIRSHDDESISSYYRINLVNGCAQSAVQFQLKWENEPNKSYKKLRDFKGAEDIPVNLDVFDSSQLDKIVKACPCQQGVIGVDVISSKGQLYLLEYNDGPNISLTVDLAEKYKDDETNQLAIEQCAQFPQAIAKVCFELSKVPGCRLMPT